MHNSKSKIQHLNCGFTLIEILVSLVILGVLSALALPSFTEVIKRYRINAIRDELTTSLQWARSEAIKRGLPVILIRQTTNCHFEVPNSQDWHCGWRVVVDANDNNVANASEATIQETTIPSGYDLMHVSPGPQQITANRWGQYTPLANKFVISPTASGISDPATTTMCISSGGRIRYAPGDATCL